MVKAFITHFDGLYEQDRLIPRYRATFLLFVASLSIISASTILISVEDFPLLFSGGAIFVGIVVFVLVFSKHLVSAQALIWMLCLSDVGYILDASRPEAVVIAEITAISFVLLVLSFHVWQSFLAMAVFIGLSSVRLYYANTSAGFVVANPLTTAYVASSVIVLSTFFMSVIIRYSTRKLEKNLDSEREKIILMNSNQQFSQKVSYQSKQINKVSAKLMFDTLTGCLSRYAYEQLLIESNVSDLAPAVFLFCRFGWIENN